MSSDQSGQSGSAGGFAAHGNGDSQSPAPGREGYARSLTEQGLWFVCDGHPHLAIRCFRRACAALPSLTVAWTSLASTLIALGRRREALLVIRSGVKAGAISRRIAARYRTAAHYNVCPDQVIARRHPVQRQAQDDMMMRRPAPGRKSAPRRQPTIYTLLRSAAYDMNCERRIPAA